MIRIPLWCWLLLLLALVLAIMAAEIFDANDDRGGVIACGYMVMLIAISAILLYAAQYASVPKALEGRPQYDYEREVPSLQDIGLRD